MTAIVLDAQTAAKLRQMSGHVMLYDPAGNFVGEFKPQDENRGVHLAIPNVSEDELRQQLRNEPTRTLPEILDDLKKQP